MDDLREMKLLNGLKLQADDLRPVTAFGVSLKGQSFVSVIPDKYKDEIRAFCHGPGEHSSHLLEMAYEHKKGFKLVTSSGYSRDSHVSHIEDVSYVCSPYLPPCTRNLRMALPFTSNKHRAKDCWNGLSNVRDVFTEAVSLKDTSIIIGEWMPFDTNQIVALVDRLGADQRCQGGYFTSMIDSRPTDTCFSLPAGLTKVKVLDFDPMKFINFEADLYYPEEAGILQVENIGIHVNVDGSVLYGVTMEAIGQRSCSSMSLDCISRVLVDLNGDSSLMMDNLLTGTQKDQLEMLFSGQSRARSKFTV